VVVEVADLVVAAAASTAVGSVVADTLQVEELAIAEAELALAGCVFRAVFRALKAQDHASLHLGIHRTRSLNQAVL
jgi:hypothetical protein